MEYAELAKLIANYGLGVACAVVLIGIHIHIVRVMIPMMIREFREEIALERKQCHENHIEISGRIGKMEEALTKLLERAPTRKG